MQEPPPVTITDPARRPGAVRDEDGAEPGGLQDPAARRPWLLRGRGALLAAAVVGVAVVQLLPGGPAPDASRPQLALVVSGEPVLDAQPGLDPTTSAEVALVNTGRRPVRLTGAVAEGLGLRWSADQVLDAGEQAVVVLRAGGACGRAAAQPAGPAPRQQLRVTAQPAAAGRAREVVLPLPASLVRRYDAFARSFCGLPPVVQALDVITEEQSLGDGEVLIEVGLASRTVERLRLVEVAPTVPGLTVELRDLAGTAVPLPLEVPGRLPADFDLREVDRYVVSVRTDPNACAVLRLPSVGTDELVQLLWVAADAPAGVAAAAVGDLQAAARDACT